jgi:hypothetical protein
MADFINNVAGTTGTVFDDCIGPGDVYECDDTTFDFHLASESDLTVILGKPTLHCCVDRASKLFLGFHLALDASNIEDAKLALLSIAQDWKALCEKHGVAYDPKDFPAQGIMCNRFFADRGPHITFASDELSNIGNDTTNAPALNARSKAIIESNFRRVGKYIKEIFGHEPQWNVQIRRRKPYELDACLTLHKLEGIVLRAMIAINREIMRGYPQNPADTAAGLMPIPREIWAREMERASALPRRVSREWLRQALLSRETATVTQNGIQFRDNYYTCKEAVEKDWFAIAKLKGPFELAVRFTPKNLDEILVQDDRRKEIRYVAKLTTKSVLITGAAQGLTDTRSAEIQAGVRHVRREADTKNLVQLVGFVQDTQPDVTAAHDLMLEATKGASNASRKTNSVELREEEAAVHRKKNHRITTKTTVPVATAIEVAAPTPLLPPVTVVVDNLLQSHSTNDTIDDFLNQLSHV